MSSISPTRIALVAAASLALLGTSPAQAAPTYAQLKAQNATLRRQLATANRLAALRLTASRTLLTRATDAEADRGAAEKVVADLQAAAAAAAAEIASLTTARDNALAGLPAAIAAVPIANFRQLVFEPARTAYPCDSFYTGSSGYWSYNFTNPDEFC